MAERKQQLRKTGGFTRLKEVVWDTPDKTAPPVWHINVQQ